MKEQRIKNQEKLSKIKKLKIIPQKGKIKLIINKKIKHNNLTINIKSNITFNHQHKRKLNGKTKQNYLSSLGNSKKDIIRKLKEKYDCHRNSSTSKFDSIKFRKLENNNLYKYNKISKRTNKMC